MWGGLCILVILIAAAIYISISKTRESRTFSSAPTAISVKEEQAKAVIESVDQQEVLTEKLQYCGRALVAQKMEIDGVDIINRILQLDQSSLCENLIANLGSSNEVRVEKEVLNDYTLFRLGTDGSGEWTYGIAEFSLRGNKLNRVGSFDGTENEIGTLK